MSGATTFRPVKDWPKLYILVRALKLCYNWPRDPVTMAGGLVAQHGPTIFTHELMREIGFTDDELKPYAELFQETATRRLVKDHKEVESVGGYNLRRVLHSLAWVWVPQTETQKYPLSSAELLVFLTHEIARRHGPLPNPSVTTYRVDEALNELAREIVQDSADELGVQEDVQVTFVDWKNKLYTLHEGFPTPMGPALVDEVGLVLSLKNQAGEVLGSKKIETWEIPAFDTVRDTTLRDYFPKTENPFEDSFLDWATMFAEDGDVTLNAQTL